MEDDRDSDPTLPSVRAPWLADGPAPIYASSHLAANVHLVRPPPRRQPWQARLETAWLRCRWRMALRFRTLAAWMAP